MKIARTRQGDAWVYDDPAVDRAITSLLGTHGLDVEKVDDWIESDDPPWDEASRQAMTVNRHRLIDAKLAGNDEAVCAWVEYFRLARYCGQMQVKLHPVAQAWKKFNNGRKKGSVGKLRIWVSKWVAKNPRGMPAQAWEALRAKPPKGFTVYASEVWVDGVEHGTTLAAFKNIVSLERKALRGE